MGTNCELSDRFMKILYNLKVEKEAFSKFVVFFLSKSGVDNFIRQKNVL